MYESERFYVHNGGCGRVLEICDFPAPKACSDRVVANLFFKNVVKLWGLPLDIVSDCDARFYRQVLDCIV